MKKNFAVSLALKHGSSYPPAVSSQFLRTKGCRMSMSRSISEMLGDSNAKLDLRSPEIRKIQIFVALRMRTRWILSRDQMRKGFSETRTQFTSGIGDFRFEATYLRCSDE